MLNDSTVYNIFVYEEVSDSELSFESHAVIDSFEDCPFYYNELGKYEIHEI